MKKNRIKIMVLAGAMAASFAACGEDKKTDTTAASTTAAQTTEASAVTMLHEEGSPAEKATVEEVKNTEEAPNEEGMMVGGWSAQDSIAITEEHKELFKKLNDQLAGATLEPMVYLGSQVVAGMNYRFLCKETAAVPDAKPIYVIAEIYQDLSGNVTVNRILESKVEAPTEQLSGGFTEPVSFEIAPDVKEAFDAAVSGLTGADYEPVANLGSQVVAGKNYRLLCRSTLAAPGAETGYAILKVYVGVDGSREILDIEDFTE